MEEWIESGKGVHSIRDHPNHDRPLNGGLWGGKHGAVKGMGRLIKSRASAQKYGMDLTFLNTAVWPTVKNDQMSHDAYTCHKHPGAVPFPTQRRRDYQHVGQVFNEHDQPRMKDIDGFLRGRRTPPQCRKKKDWEFG